MNVVQALADGLLIGGVYALISIGLTLVFGVMGIVNFAHGAFLMLGMYVAYQTYVYVGLDPLIGGIVALGVVFILGAIIFRTLIARILRAPEISQIFLTLGLLIVLENAALIYFGPSLRSVETPYKNSAIQFGPIFFNAAYLAAFVASIAIGVLLYLFLQRTYLGRAMRATAQNVMAARLLGVNTRRVQWIAFGLGTGLTAFGGGAILAYGSVYPTVSEQYIVLMFTAVVLGGLGSILGAVVGGVVVGLIQSLSVLVLPYDLQNLIVFLALMGVLAFKPTGLLGKGGT
jgi:branched-chain amino acid transport system permease protein